MVCFCIQRRSLFPQDLSTPASYSPPATIVLCGIKLHFHMQRVLWCICIRYLAILSVQDMVMSCSPSNTPSHVWAALWHRTGMVPSPDSIFVRRCPRYFLTMCLLLFTGQNKHKNGNNYMFLERTWEDAIVCICRTSCGGPLNWMQN